jgi:BMFP domain-containing protein YqiC
MQTSNRLFDDFAKMASGALHTLGGLREEIETRVRERIERMAADMDLVTREEFDAVKAMAAKARSEQEDLAAKMVRLEAELAALKGHSEAGEAETPEVKKSRPRKAKAQTPHPEPEAGIP